jgi:hypothetical protein
MTTLENKIKKMLQEQSAKVIAEGTLGVDEAEAASAAVQKTGLPVGNPEPGDVVAPASGGSVIPEIEELDDDAPGADAANKIGQTAPIAVVGNALEAVVGGMSEDVKQLFDGQELTEDFKAKATGLFEAAVIARVNHEMLTVKSVLAETAQKEAEKAKEALYEQADSFMTFAVAEWAKDNAVGIKQGLRSEITESFMTGLKGLYEESMLNVSDEQLDVVTALTEANDQLKELQNETVEKLLEAKSAKDKDIQALQEQIVTLQKEQIVESVSKGLTALDTEKLKTLIEGVEFSSKELFTEKVSLIKNTHFGKQKGSSPSILEESVQVVNKVSGVMNAYTEALKHASR